MPLNSTALIVIGAVLIIGVLIWRATGKSVHIRNSKGNFIGGNVSGSTTQVYRGDTTIGAADGKIRAKEIVTWLIAILGVAATALGVYHAWFSNHH